MESTDPRWLSHMQDRIPAFRYTLMTPYNIFSSTPSKLCRRYVKSDYSTLFYPCHTSTGRKTNRLQLERFPRKSESPQRPTRSRESNKYPRPRGERMTQTRKPRPSPSRSSSLNHVRTSEMRRSQQFVKQPALRKVLMQGPKL